MPKNVCLLLLIGLPGSGKTEMCKLLLNKLVSYSNKEEEFKIEHICFDDLLDPADSNVKWRASRDNMMSETQQHIQRLTEEPKYKEKKIVILIDDNMYYQSMRRLYYRLAKKQNYAFCQLYMQCDVNLAFSRVLARNTQAGAVLPIPVEVIHRMAQRLEPPNTASSWETLSLTVDTSPKVESGSSFQYAVNDSFGEEAAVLAVQGLLMDAFERCQNLKSKDHTCNDRLPSNSTALQKLDVALRKSISAQVTVAKCCGKKPAELKVLAQNLNDSRRTCLINATLRKFSCEDIENVVKDFVKHFDCN